MTIQWFPGHMNAARRQAAKTMETTDLVVEVLDARLPQASCNPMIEELRLFRQRPCLKILNKSDLADPKVTQQWIDYFEQDEKIRAISLNSKKSAEVSKIPALCQSLVPHRGDASKVLRIMIMGVPNVGKSTLMNALLKRRVAAVGNEPAVTKSQQRLQLNKNIVLVDTPGMLWPKIEYQSDGFMLAAGHAIGVRALIEEDVAVFLADVLLARYPQLLEVRYGIQTKDMDAVDMMEAVAQKRGLRIKGGLLDMEKAAQVFLHDFRSGALGRISLETPETRRMMIEKVQKEREEKEREENPVSAVEDS